MPLDLAFAVRAYLRVLKPSALILMESELWPRMLHECGRAGIPVAVVNARMSDRSFARAMRMQWIWGRVMRKPKLWLAQSEQDALRLVIVGVRAESISVAGNLKYDIRGQENNAMTRRIAPLLGQMRLIVAGSTLETEEAAFLDALLATQASSPDAALLLAPRHPERFDAVAAQIRQRGCTVLRCSGISGDTKPISAGTVLLLDTIGDLASVYALGALAFVGGSLVNRGGHNPLEPAQFGVPVMMGPSFENFRDIVAKMQEAEGIRIVTRRELELTLGELLNNHELTRAMGERGRHVFAAQQGATKRSVDALTGMIAGARL
jgi:3-deoxy-D-manno-octulosonic-acid transferase